MPDADGTATPSASAPVALFVHRRVAHAARMIDSLLACDGVARAPVWVFSDGPRSEAEVAEVAAVRQLVAERLGARAIVVASERNLGLAASVIAGVNRVLALHERVIVVEDDLELAPGFLTFMNEALHAFADTPAVMGVSGFAYEVPGHRPAAPSFLGFPSSWGWATWRRAWREFDASASGWEALRTDRAMRDRFDLDGAVDNAGMLEWQMTGRLDSWAIRWEWTVFRRGGLVLYPARTLVRNTGFDGSGTHGGWLARRFVRGELDDARAFVMPRHVAEDTRRHAATARFLRSRNLARRFPLLAFGRRLARSLLALARPQR